MGYYDWIKDDYRKPKFVWDSAVGQCAAQGGGGTSPSTTWRVLGRRADEIKAILLKTSGHPEADDTRRINEQIAGAERALRNLPSAVRDAHLPPMKSWLNGMSKAVTANSATWAGSLSKNARKRAADIEAKATSARAAKWRDWLGATGLERQGLIKPGRNAFRWIKGLAGWEPSPVGNESLNDEVPNDEEEDCGLDDLPVECKVHERGGEALLTAPLCDQAAIELEASGWAKLWAENAVYDSGVWNDAGEALPNLTVEQVREAALSFPADTGVGADNISPRAIARLSDNAIRSLISILHLAERQGRWPEELNLVLIVLIPKSDGGTRPIGLFPTIIRIWMRARSPMARQWEAERPNRSMFGGAGMGAQRAAWAAAFTAENARHGGDEHAQALIDLVKAFEKIPHALLVKAAAKHNFPLRLLRLSLAAYRLQRAIGIGGK